MCQHFQVPEKTYWFQDREIKREESILSCRSNPIKSQDREITREWESILSFRSNPIKSQEQELKREESILSCRSNPIKSQDREIKREESILSCRGKPINSWPKWSCKLYLRGKVLLIQFIINECNKSFHNRIIVAYHLFLRFEIIRGTYANWYSEAADLKMAGW